MKEELKDILLMGLGAVSLTSDKAKELKDELLKEGMKVYEEGKVKNEELKHHIQESLSSPFKEKSLTKEEVKKAVMVMSKEEKEEILSLLKNQEENIQKDDVVEND